MSKKKINSRSKGMRAERALVKLFADWWGTEFFRTPGSGSFATMGFSHKDMDLAGDICTTDAEFPFCVESKNAEGWHLEQLMTAKKCDIIDWWKQAVNETPDGKIPLLVFTRNHQPLFFVIPLDAWDSVTMLRSDVTGFPMFIIEGQIVKMGLLPELFKTTPEQWKHERRKEREGSQEATRASTP